MAGDTKDERPRRGLSLQTQVFFFIAMIVLCLVMINGTINEQSISSSRREQMTHSFREESEGSHLDLMHRVQGQHASSRQKNILKHGYQNSDKASKDVASLHSHVNGVDWEYKGTFANAHNSSRYESIVCPEIPPVNYPHQYPVRQVIENWNPDDTRIPPMHFDSLCHFDYETEYHKAERYREAELPFILYNYPEVDSSTERWNDLDWLREKLGKDKKYAAETSINNHFMYYNRGVKKETPEDWIAPTGTTHVTLDEYLELTEKNDRKAMEDREYVYFRVSGSDGAGRGKGMNEWLYDDLKLFSPGNRGNLVMIEMSRQKGIHCRLGMAGVIAEDHYDGSRNTIVQLRGLRRWIMSHPNQCGNMYLYPMGHPSARHSSVDWSNPDWQNFPKFEDLHVNEVILQPGDVVYLPTYWFHYIVSLTANAQCNSRSGLSAHYEEDLNECGFGMYRGSTGPKSVLASLFKNKKKSYKEKDTSEEGRADGARGDNGDAHDKEKRFKRIMKERKSRKKSLFENVDDAKAAEMKAFFKRLKDKGGGGRDVGASEQRLRKHGRARSEESGSSQGRSSIVKKSREHSSRLRDKQLSALKSRKAEADALAASKLSKD